MATTQQRFPRFRRRDIPRDARVVLVRGGADNPEVDRTQTQDFFDR